MIIFGAGLAGCIAGIMNADATILEGSSEHRPNHQALLRFRSPIVSEVTGVPFEKVHVQKAIWFEGKERDPSPRFTALYSRKVTGGVSRRSIYNIDDEVRYIAPRDFHTILIRRLLNRLIFDFKVQAVGVTGVVGENDRYQPREAKEPIITTLPLPTMALITGYSSILEEFSGERSKPIEVYRSTIPGCNIHTTVYYPQFDSPVYRSSITGDQLIIEAMRPLRHNDLNMVESAMGIVLDKESLKHYQQPIGKLTPIDDQQRRNFIFNLTTKHNIFSLGRFATWRNILLDDVVHDIYQINRLSQDDHYQLLKES
jgi:hypothetical protein